MKIGARVHNGNQALVATLTARGITAKLVKGGVIVELPSWTRSSSDPTMYILPAEVNVSTAVLFLDLTEHGGGATHTGSGTVVCGLSGKPLRPYYIPHGGHLACGTHAHFSVPNAAVTVTGYRDDNNVTIKKHLIVRDGDVAWIESTQLWSGDLSDLPEMYSHYRAAAEAANTKGNCYHCRCVHFAAE